MDYAEIKSAAYTYADRTDTEALNSYDVFLRVVESRVNRVLQTLKMATRTAIVTSLTSDYYGLPADFTGMRDLRVNNNTTPSSGTQMVSCKYVSPSQMAEKHNTTETGGAVYYTIISNQLHIQPPLDSKTLEMIYYKKVPKLSAIKTTNWLSIDHPDCYIFGVLTELSAFVKDKEAAVLWGDRFSTALSEIKNNDIDIRWDSGDMLVMRTL